MKKLLLSTIVLALFAVVLMLVQVSCVKTSAQPTPSQQSNKIAYVLVTGNAASLKGEIWIANYDGTNKIKVPVNLPAGVEVAYDITSTVRISPDGQKLFLLLFEITSGKALSIPATSMALTCSP